MGRAAWLVIGLETAAVVLAYLGFGALALLVGIPALLGTGLVLLVVGLSERPRAHLRAVRAARHTEAPLAGGLMSGFYEVSAIPAQRVAPEVDHTRA